MSILSIGITYAILLIGVAIKTQKTYLLLVAFKYFFTFVKTTIMQDRIEIKSGRIVANLSINIEEKDNSFLGYIPSLDIPFTAASKDSVGEIAGGLITTLFNIWLKKGNMTLFIEKLKKHNFIQKHDANEFHFSHKSGSNSIKIKQELNVA
jgi:hypothetical protein